MPAVLKAPASMDRQPGIGQPLHQFPGRWTFLDRGDQNGSAACIGNLEAHATINRSFAGQFMCAPDDLHEQGSRVREFNPIGIFHNAKVIADVKVVDAHRVAALSARQNLTRISVDPGIRPSRSMLVGWSD